jgi:transmembrane protein 231
MGALFSAPIVHEEPVKTQFQAAGVNAWCLEAIGLLTVLIIPIVIALAMGQFWIQHNVYYEVPTVTYSGRYMVRAVASDGSEYMWSSSEQLQDALASDPRASMPFVAVHTDDADRDGKPDKFNFQFRFPLRDPAHVIDHFEFLPTFTFELSNELIKVNMEGAPFAQHTGGAGGGRQASALILDGTIPFTQVQPIYASYLVRYTNVYKRSYLDTVRDVSEISGMAKIAQRYAARNESLVYSKSAGYWSNTQQAKARRGTVTTNGTTTTVTSPKNFVADVTMRTVPARVDYVPSLAETLKHAWVQYFCIAYVIRWAYGIIRKVVVTQALVNTVALVHGRR